MAKSPGLDRAGLVALMQKYIGSLHEHSADGLPLAPNVKITEQAARIPVGDGLWISATGGPTDFQIWLADPVSGQAGFYGVIHEWGKPVLLGTRIKVEEGKITEIENVMARNLREAAMENLQKPRAGLIEDVPASERTPRKQMLEIANSYFNSIEQDDGDLCPFADECVRVENGIQTTLNKTPPAPGQGIFNDPAVAEVMGHLLTMKTRDSMSTGSLAYITQIRPRHMLVCDEQKGVVFGFPRFCHRGDMRTTKLRNVPGFTEMPFGHGPDDLQASEMFKIGAGKVYEIEANGFINAYLAPTGWDEEYPETYEYEVTHPWGNPQRPPNAKKSP